MKWHITAAPWQLDSGAVIDAQTLAPYVGQTLIVTDGETLLGADDKAGVAEIVSAVAELLAHPELQHGPVSVAFTPDEEIGCGTEHFDLETFGAPLAYTVDGGRPGRAGILRISMRPMPVCALPASIFIRAKQKIKCAMPF